MIEWLNKYLLGAAVPVCLISVGIFFGFELGWFHILHPIRTLKLALSGNRRRAFSALSLALAGTLGVGNMVGVAGALAVGGCGAVFWMWVSALFAMILKYAEIVLSVRHRRYDVNGGPHGSAMLYIKDVLTERGFPRLGGAVAVVFALLLILNALTMGGLLQVGAVTEAAEDTMSVPAPVCSGIMALLTLAVSVGGSKALIRLTDRVVPIMSAAVLLLSVVAIALRANEVPVALARIFSEAFEVRAAGGGILGFLLSDAIRLGTMRGLVSNEAGCGTSPTAHAEANATSPAAQGIFGIFEVFVDTVLLCTLTALVIIVSGVEAEGGRLMSMTMNAYSSILGEWSEYLLTGAVFCFGLATVLCWSHYGAEGVVYITESSAAKRGFSILFCITVLLGGIISSEAAWQSADLAIGLMTLINLSVLVLAEKEIAEETRRALDIPVRMCYYRIRKAFFRLFKRDTCV